MAKKLFVGNLPWSISQDDLMAAFSEYGSVDEAIIIMDRFSGRSKGFGFVTYSNDAEADAAIEAFNGKDFKGRELVVNEARPMEQRD